MDNLSTYAAPAAATLDHVEKIAAINAPNTAAAECFRTLGRIKATAAHVPDSAGHMSCAAMPSGRGSTAKRRRGEADLFENNVTIGPQRERRLADLFGKTNSNDDELSDLFVDSVASSSKRRRRGGRRSGRSRSRGASRREQPSASVAAQSSRSARRTRPPPVSNPEAHRRASDTRRQERKQREAEKQREPEDERDAEEDLHAEEQPQAENQQEAEKQREAEKCRDAAKQREAERRRRIRFDLLTTSPATVKQSKAEKQQMVRVATTPASEPAVEPQPAVDSQPAVYPQPAVEPQPAESQPAVDPQPKVELQSEMEVHPKVEVQPELQAKEELPPPMETQREAKVRRHVRFELAESSPVPEPTMEPQLEAQSEAKYQPEVQLETEHMDSQRVVKLQPALQPTIDQLTAELQPMVDSQLMMKPQFEMGILPVAELHTLVDLHPELGRRPVARAKQEHTPDEPSDYPSPPRQDGPNGSMSESVSEKQASSPPPPAGRPTSCLFTNVKKSDLVRDELHESKSLRAVIENTILRESPKVSWDDIAGLEDAKKALKEAVILPVKFPQLFTGNRKPVAGILLYGAPGTGKSYLAKAVATEAEATFFSVSSSDLVGRWTGESERLIKQLFMAARKAKPSVIFIDEIDALCGQRRSSDGSTAGRMTAELLVQMNGVGKNLDGVTVIGATNTPWHLDVPVLRRFERRIHTPLPDEACRTRMFELSTNKEPTALTVADCEVLAELSRGFSGADISVAVKDALMEPIRKLQQATHFREVTPKGAAQRKVAPCNPTDEGAVESSLTDIKMDELELPPPQLNDFMRSVRLTRPTVNEKDAQRQIEFTKRFG